MFFIGIYYLGTWTYRIISAAYITLWGTKCTTERYGSDTYAIITGCTGGTGYEAAYYLANEGFNLILIANDEIKLEEVRVQLLN
jgi:hypothetical protein